MANVMDPTPEQQSDWDAWVSERPRPVREVIQKYERTNERTNERLSDNRNKIVMTHKQLLISLGVLPWILHCELPVNGTGPDDPKLESQPVVVSTDAGSKHDSSDARNPNGEIPLNLTTCENPPAAGYAKTIPTQCASTLAYWTSVNVVYFPADGSCQLSGTETCACDYTCDCILNHPATEGALSACACSQANPNSVLILNCPTL